MPEPGPVVKHVADAPWTSAEPFGFPPPPEGPVCRVFGDGAEEPAGQMTILARFPAGFVEARHVHDDLDHWCVIVDGEMHVDGEVLTAGDYFYAPLGIHHGPLSYPVGCTVFTTVRGRHFAHDFDAGAASG